MNGAPSPHATKRPRGLSSAFSASPLLPIGSSNQALTGLRTTVAFPTLSSDLLPDGWERMDERRIDRGDAGALGGIAAGGEGADAPVVHTGAGGGLGGSVS